MEIKHWKDFRENRYRIDSKRHPLYPKSTIMEPVKVFSEKDPDFRLADTLKQGLPLYDKDKYFREVLGVPTLAEATLEAFCLDETTSNESYLIWQDCAECNSWFRSDDDYLCRDCRAKV